MLVQLGQFKEPPFQAFQHCDDLVGKSDEARGISERNAVLVDRASPWVSAQSRCRRAFASISNKNAHPLEAERRAARIRKPRQRVSTYLCVSSGDPLAIVTRDEGAISEILYCSIEHGMRQSYQRRALPRTALEQLTGQGGRLGNRQVCASRQRSHASRIAVARLRSCYAQCGG